MPPISQRYPYPRINGRYAQHASIQVMIKGVNFYDIPSISGIGDACEPGVVGGLSRVRLGLTAGNLEPEDLQITFFHSFWPFVENAIDPLGEGLYDVWPIPIHMEISEKGIPKQTRDWVGLALSKVSDEGSNYGNDPLRTVATFKPIALIRNGRNPVTGIDFGYKPSLLNIGTSV